MSRDESDVPELREWFESTEKQEHAAELGMWLFLTSEVLLFGALFGLYTAYRVDHGEAFAKASHHNDVLIGTINTLILVTSSFAVAWAIHALRHAKRKVAVMSLLSAVAMGAVFLLLKAIEYEKHIRHGILPGSLYNSQELPGEGANLFFTLYYFMTGLHALHVLGGMVALLAVAAMVWRRSVRPAYTTPLENVGLYWHLVDAVWIFLWPLLYLVG